MSPSLDQHKIPQLENSPKSNAICLLLQSVIRRCKTAPERRA